jgi:hypothetical protein
VVEEEVTGNVRPDAPRRDRHDARAVTTSEVAQGVGGPWSRYGRVYGYAVGEGGLTAERGMSINRADERRRRECARDRGRRGLDLDRLRGHDDVAVMTSSESGRRCSMDAHADAGGHMRECCRRSFGHVEVW